MSRAYGWWIWLINVQQKYTHQERWKHCEKTECLWGSRAPLVADAWVSAASLWGVGSKTRAGEPSIALDPRNRRNLIHILNGFEHLKIIASHDLDLVLDTCERTILMSGGRIVSDGATKDILTDKALLEANGLELPSCLQNKGIWNITCAQTGPSTVGGTSHLNPWQIEIQGQRTLSNERSPALFYAAKQLSENTYWQSG